MTLLPEDQVESAVQIIESVVGSLEEENAGLVFTLPVGYVRGLKRHGK